MSTLAHTRVIAEPAGVRVSRDTLSVDLSDGRSISVPLTWFPRLLHGTPKERSGFELGHFGIHWPDLDEDISVEGLLAGEKSGESMKSLHRWLERRSRDEKVPVPTFPLPPVMAKAIQEERTPRGRRAQRRGS